MYVLVNVTGVRPQTFPRIWQENKLFISSKGKQTLSFPANEKQSVYLDNFLVPPLYFKCPVPYYRYSHASMFTLLCSTFKNATPVF